MPVKKAKIWYLAHPLSQYQENAKALAKKAGLKIIDSKVTESRVNAADNVPELTIKGQAKPKPKRRKSTKAE